MWWVGSPRETRRGCLASHALGGVKRGHIHTQVTLLLLASGLHPGMGVRQLGHKLEATEQAVHCTCVPMLQ